MAHSKHEVTAKSNPNFKPDPNARHVYDEKKGVFRLVTTTKQSKDKRKD